MKRTLKRIALGLLVLFVILQLLPFGRPGDNPPVTKEPDWAGARTRELAKRACFDCHSNETTWPWYSYVAPISWIVRHDVDEGREHLNFSEFDRPQKDADEAAEELEEGHMPPAGYLRFHPEAQLGDAEKTELIRGLRATFGGHDD